MKCQGRFYNKFIAVLAIVFVTITINTCEAFVSRSSSATSSAASSTDLHMFGNAFKKAFANDDNLGKPQNAGLKNGPQGNDGVTFNGKPVQAVVGQKVSVVLAKARAPVTYSCKKGDCGTCEITINGRIVKACQAKIPPGRCDMATFR